MSLRQRPANGLILSVAGTVFAVLAPLGAIVLYIRSPESYVSPMVIYDLVSGLLVLVAAILLYVMPSRHFFLGIAIVVFSAAEILLYDVILILGFDFSVEYLIDGLLRTTILFGASAALGIVGGGLAIVWKPREPVGAAAGLVGKSETPPGSARGFGGAGQPRSPWGSLSGRRGFGFAACLAGGIGMATAGVSLLGPYLESQQNVSHYYGVPVDVILWWIEYGLAAVASSVLLLALPRYRVSLAVLALVVSSMYTLQVLYTSYFRVTDGLLAMPGILGILGGAMALWRPRESSGDGEAATGTL